MRGSNREYFFDIWTAKEAYVKAIGKAGHKIQIAFI
ncbi:MAG: 4'-phosphopantetheinyl transferase superfamily protein [Thomasclavelia spiroformis]